MTLKIKVIDRRQNKTYEISTRCTTIMQLLQEQNLLEDEFLTALNNRLVPACEKIRDKDTIILYPVVSGG